MANVIVKRSNRLGIPLIEAQGITSDGTTTTVSFNNHVNLSDYFVGVFMVKFPNVVTSTTQPVVFATSGVSGTTPLYTRTGAQATVANIQSTVAPTYHLFVYDSVSSRLQLIN